MQTNCYFITKDNKCLIIDAGESADSLLEEIQRKKLKPLAVFATHGHFDHIMAVGEIQLSFHIPFYICDKDLFLVKRVRETAEHFLRGDITVIQPKFIKNLRENILDLSNFKFQILYSPGHTPGAVCYYFENEGWLFTGDTLFKDAIGRYDFSYSDKRKLQKSLDKLFALPQQTIVYPGHGEQTTIGAEKRHRLI